MDYSVDVAGAAKQNELYVEDFAILKPKYESLDGAQSNYADAKAAQDSAYTQLAEKLGRIEETVNCALGSDVRDHLSECWTTVSAANQPPAPASCADVDKIKSWGDVVGKTIAELKPLIEQAASCKQQADGEFDRLSGLPESLATEITALTGRATTLEEALCGPRTDVERTFVLYLELKEDVDELKKDWVTPSGYACSLKNAFDLMLKRHVIVIWLAVAIERLLKRKAVEARANEDKAKQVIDLVIECANQKPTATTGTAAQPDPATPTTAQAT